MAVGKFHNKAQTAGSTGTLSFNLIEYTSTTTWSKPSGLIMLEVVCVGAGGGGGSGSRQATGVLSRGGGGGAGGNVVFTQLLASSLASSETVTVGAQGN
jgi:hypothetical protein